MNNKILHYNILANFIGNISGAILSFVFIPLYIRYLGAEAYGIIGFYIAISGAISILDFGMGGTLNRAISKIKVDNKEIVSALNLLKSFEIINILIAIIVGLTIGLLSGYITNHWINFNILDSKTVKNSIILIALIISIKWPSAIYISAFNGLEKQVAVNVIQFSYALFVSVGIIVLFQFLPNTLIVYFLWQLFCTIIFVLVLKFLMVQETKKFLYRGKFDISVLKEIRSFTFGLGLISIFSATYTHFDKLIISKFITLEEFGYYSIAASISAVIYKFIYPISGAIYPRIVQIILINSKKDVILFFHKTCQAISLLVVPIGLTISFFSTDLIYLWSHNELLSKNVSIIASLLIIGTIFSGLASTAYNFQLAYGYTKILLIQNLIGTLVLFPLLYTLIHYFGVIGAAFVWIIINFGYLTVSQIFFFRKFFKSEMINWIIYDIIIPIIISVIILLIFKNLINTIKINIIRYILIMMSGILSILFVGMSMNNTRKFIVDFLRNKLKINE